MAHYCIAVYMPIFICLIKVTIYNMSFKGNSMEEKQATDFVRSHCQYVLKIKHYNFLKGFSKTVLLLNCWAIYESQLGN